MVQGMIDGLNGKQSTRNFEYLCLEVVRKKLSIQGSTCHYHLKSLSLLLQLLYQP